MAASEPEFSLEAQTSLADRRVFEGDAYAVTGDFVTVDSGAARGILYLQNTAERLFAVTSIRVSVLNGTLQVRIRQGTPGDALAGTLISDGTAITPRNARFGSSKTFTGVARANDTDTRTLTGGKLREQFVFGNDGPGTGAARAVENVFSNVVAVLDEGDEIGITGEPNDVDTTIGATIFGYYV